MSTTIHRQILINADRLLSSPDKWHRGDLGTHDHPCLIGAIFYAAQDMGIKAGNNEPYVRAEDALRDVIRKTPRYRFVTGLALFNDAQTTTFADVKAVLREAINNAG